mgnify:FL=1
MRANRASRRKVLLTSAKRKGKLKFEMIVRIDYCRRRTMSAITRIAGLNAYCSAE